MKEYLSAFQKYAQFSGRATRKEFWMFELFQCLIGGVLGGIVGANPTSQGWRAFACFFVLATIIPNWALLTRRVHDIGKSGWCILWAVVPIIGEICLLIWLLTAGQRNENQYGTSPYLEENEFDRVLLPVAVVQEQQDCGVSVDTAVEEQQKASHVSTDTALEIEEEQRYKIPVSILILVAVLIVFVFIIGNSHSKLKEQYSKMEEDYDFLYQSAVFVSEKRDMYHRVDCEDVEKMKSFYVFNPEYAQGQGYKECPKCSISEKN